jgi:hypothetical protein
MPNQSERGRTKKPAARISEPPESVQAVVQVQARSGEDLRSREYRDKDGTIHHHTRRFMEQHRGSS